MNTPKPTFDTSKEFKELMAPFFKAILICLAMNTLEEIVALAFPYSMKVIIDIMNDTSHRSWESIVTACGGLAAIAAIHAFIAMKSNVASGRLRTNIDRVLIDQALTVQVALPISYHAKVGRDEKLLVITKGASAIREIVSLLSFNLIPQGIRVFCVLALVAISSPAMALIMVGFMVMLFFAVRSRDRKVAPIKEAVHNLQKQETKHLSDVLSNMKSVQIFGQSQRELSQFQIWKDRLFEQQISEWDVMFREYPTRMAIRRLMQISIFLYGYHLTTTSDISLGTVIMCWTLANTVSDLIAMISTNWTRVSDQKPEAEDFLKMLKTESDVRDPEHPLPLDDVRGAVTFEDVSFSYPERANAVRHASFTVRPGATVAFVGETGGGKSTITMLLARGFDVDSGVIRIDGKDIRAVRRRDLWSKMAIVPQESELFQRSIAENIAFGKPDATLDEIVEAAKMARAHEFIIKKNPKGPPDRQGYNAVIGERGVNLSGGERQRIAIARAILKNPAILILDEATSQIDVETEQEVKEAIDAVRKNRTTIVIAHRLSTIQNADHIFVMRDGEIVEQGTHKTLRASSGYYETLCKRAEMSTQAIQ